MVLEAGPPYDIARWAVRTKNDRFRMKVATTPEAKARLTWGARVHVALAHVALRGSHVPCSPVAFVRGGDDPARETPLVVVESSPGTDAASRWDRLPRAAREALADPLARALERLHAVPAERLPEEVRAAGTAARAARPWREAVGAGVARRAARLREQGALAPDLLRRVEDRLASEVERIPAGVERALCHGRVRPAAVLLE